VAVRLYEGIERRVGVALQAEHGVQAALGVGVQQGEGVVAAVIDDDVAGGEGVEMQPGGTALVSVGVQAEVDRQAGMQAVQATEQALRVIGHRGGCAVAGLDERAGQVELGAVDGEDAVAQPQAVGRVRGHLASTAWWMRRKSSGSALLRGWTHNNVQGSDFRSCADRCPTAMGSQRIEIVRATRPRHHSLD